MGYVCPVCESPQADGEHLANHLAFTAMLGDDDHEAWLDEHAPGWGECDPATLAERVVDHADEGEFPQVFEDTTGYGMDEHNPPSGTANADVPDGDGDGDAVPPDVLAEARELTRERRAAAEGNGEGETEGDGADTGGDADDDGAPDADDGTDDGTD